MNRETIEDSRLLPVGFEVSLAGTSIRGKVHRQGQTLIAIKWETEKQPSIYFHYVITPMLRDSSKELRTA